MPYVMLEARVHSFVRHYKNQSKELLHFTKQKHLLNHGRIKGEKDVKLR